MIRLVAAVLLLLAWFTPAEATRLFTTGAEENVPATNLAVWNTTFSGMSSIGTAPHSGSYELRASSAASSASAIRTWTALTSGVTVYTRVYLKIISEPNADLVTLVAHRHNTGNAWTRIRYRNASNVLQVYNTATTTGVDCTQALSTATWYRLEIRQYLHATAGQTELRIYAADGASPLDTCGIGAFAGGNGINENTLQTNLDGLLVGGSFVVNSSDLRFDDIAVETDGGWIGPGKIFLLTPDGDASVTWTKAGSAPAATNYEGVDEVPGTPDDATTYNSSTTNGQIDRLTLTNLGAEVTADATLRYMHVMGRVGSDGTTGTRTFTYRIWDHTAATTTGPSVSASINGWRTPTTAEYLVKTMGGYTKANVDTFSVGYVMTGDSNVFIGTVWVNVEWIESGPPPPAGGVCTRALMGVGC